jgi:cell division protease FtsH
VRRIVEGCYDRARRMLAENRDRLESLTQALLEKETLDEDDAYRAAGFDRGSAPGDADGAADGQADGAGDAPAELPEPETPPALPPATSG